MATRQYIGARYVVKIYENSVDPSTAEWEANVNYEPLTMVTYNNGSYLSKKTVPANIGNPASNPTYWVQTGFYNGQIASLEEQVSELNVDVDTLKQRELSNRKFLFVGDSYIAAHANTCVEFACSVLGIPASNYVNISVSGSAFSYTTEGAMVNQLINYNGSINREDVTDIIVIGGLNDAVQPANDTGIAAIMTGMETFVDYANTNYPNAEIMICYAGAAKEDASLDGRNYEKRNWARLVYSRFSQSRNVIVHSDMCYCLSVPGAFNSDDMHPSEVGQRVLSNALVSYIKGADYKVFSQYKLYPITDTANSIRFEIDGDTATVQIGAQLVFNLPVGTYDGYSDIEIGTVEGLYTNRAITIPCTMLMRSVNSDTYYICSLGRLRLDGNKLKFSAQSYNTSDIESFTFTSSSRLIVQPALVSFATSFLV